MFQDSSRTNVAIFNQQAELNFADTRANFVDFISRAEKEEKEREREEGRETYFERDYDACTRRHSPCDRKHCVIVTRARVVSRVGGRALGGSAR